MFVMYIMLKVKLMEFSIPTPVDSLFKGLISTKMKTFLCIS